MTTQHTNITPDAPLDEKIQAVIETYAQHVENNTSDRYDARSAVIDDETSEWLDEIVELGHAMGWRIEESEDAMIALASAADLWRMTLTTPRTGIIEAKCDRCGETFNPTTPYDFEHGVTINGDECGGGGRLVGYAA